MVNGDVPNFIVHLNKEYLGKVPPKEDFFSILLEADRAPAAAGPRGIGVFNDEPGPPEILHVVDFGSVQVLGALGVQEHFNVPGLIHLVAIARLVEGKTVGKTAAPAA